VFAIGHEIGNHLGGIRLQAHLLDEDLDARGLAEASIEIDGLAGRSGPLLALLRPILSPSQQEGSRLGWSALLAGVQQQLEDDGTRGVRLEIEAPNDPGSEAPGVDWLHSLLIALVGSTLEGVEAPGTVSLRLEVRDGRAVLVLEDEGAQEELERGSALRGRGLSVAVARCLLESIGGWVETRRVGSKTCIELGFSQEQQAP
jgi:hypothetical protein